MLIDKLTGVLNRRAFNEHVNAMLEVAQRRNDKFSLLMLDFDYFKNVNDQYGHQVGDVVLVQCARKISSIIREHVLLYRVGGEEFCVLLPNAIKDEAMNVAEK